MFYLFPNRNYKRMYRVLLCEYRADTLDEYFKIDKEQEEYEKVTGTFLTWLASFIPGNDAYETRKVFYKKIQKGAQDFEKDLKDPKAEYDEIEGNIEKRYYLTAAFPSWKKTLLMAFATIVLLVLAATGIGALAGLGVLGITLAGLAASKLALSLIGVVAAKLMVSTFTVAMVTASVSGYLAILTASEWLEPGKLFKSFIYNRAIHHKLFPGNFGKEFAKDIEIIEVNEHERKDSLENLIKLLLNPLRWTENLLLTLERVLFSAIDFFREKKEKSPLPLKVIKGLINVPFQLVVIPIQLFKPIVDIPYYILKVLFITSVAALSFIRQCCRGGNNDNLSETIKSDSNTYTNVHNIRSSQNPNDSQSSKPTFRSPVTNEPDSRPRSMNQPSTATPNVPTTSTTTTFGYGSSST